MRIIGIIPSRYASTRFPGKPLIDIAGKSMIQRVYEQASKARLLSEVWVATDDSRIEDHVHSFGGRVKMTSAEHQSGTDRCAEVLGFFSEVQAVINIQGDEPLMDPQQIDQVASCFDDPDTEIATLVKKINDWNELESANIVKVVRNLYSKALYFSRSPIPFLRGIEKADWLRQQDYFKHIGIYGYRSDVLRKISTLNQSFLERSESLEQLRWLENDIRISLRETEIETQAIDSPEDLQKVLKTFI